MARNSATPLTFKLPDGDQVNLITWDFVLNESDKRMELILEKMSKCNEHLEEIAKKLEEFIDEEE